MGLKATLAKRIVFFSVSRAGEWAVGNRKVRVFQEFISWKWSPQWNKNQILLWQYVFVTQKMGKNKLIARLGVQGAWDDYHSAWRVFFYYVVNLKIPQNFLSYIQLLLSRLSVNWGSLNFLLVGIKILGNCGWFHRSFSSVFAAVRLRSRRNAAVCLGIGYIHIWFFFFARAHPEVADVRNRELFKFWKKRSIYPARTLRLA